MRVVGGGKVGRTLPEPADRGKSPLLPLHWIAATDLWKRFINAGANHVGHRPALVSGLHFKGLKLGLS